MPLRVAEKDGYLKAVNRCIYDCPFCLKISSERKVFPVDDDLSGYGCFHSKIVQNGIGENIKPVWIPVWCPLPEPIDSWLHRKPKTMTEFMVRKENEK